MACGLCTVQVDEVQRVLARAAFTVVSIVLVSLT
jgi:hypothetical protein